MIMDLLFQVLLTTAAAVAVDWALMYEMQLIMGIVTHRGGKEIRYSLRSPARILAIGLYLVPLNYIAYNRMADFGIAWILMFVTLVIYGIVVTIDALRSQKMRDDG